MIIIEKEKPVEFKNNQVKFISPKTKKKLVLNKDESMLTTLEKNEKFKIDNDIIIFVE